MRDRVEFLQERIGLKSEFGFDIRATIGCSVANRMSEPFVLLFSPEEQEPTGFPFSRE